MRLRKVVLGTALVAAAAAVLASVAWACTWSVGMYPLSVPEGPPGTEVKVSGSAPGSQPAQVRWDGVRGPLLATAALDKEGAFSAEVEIPEARPGVHYVVVVGQPSSETTDQVWTRAAFRVTGTASRPSEPVEALTPEQALGETELWDTRDRGGSRHSSLPVQAGTILLIVGGLGLVAGVGVAGARRRHALAARNNA